VFNIPQTKPPPAADAKDEDNLRRSRSALYIVKIRFRKVAGIRRNKRDRETTG
jgi:hypothetical protein